MSTVMAQIDIAQWLAQRLANEMAIPVEAVDRTKPFVDYGIDSASAVGIVADLEDFLQRPLDPNLFYEYPSIDDLVEYLASAAPDTAAPSVDHSAESQR